MIHLDFETRSRADLKKVGPWAYSLHESTEVLCLAYSLFPGVVDSWRAFDFGFIGGNVSFPAELIEHIKAGDTICAHNAFFEFAIWNNTLCRRFPKLPKIGIDRFDCTSARALVCALPRDLDRLGTAVNAAVKKDKAGHQIMLKMSKPRKASKTNALTFFEDAEDYDKLVAYCEDDVWAESSIDGILPPLTPDAKELWQITQRMNRRGVYVDRPAVKAALNIIEKLSTKYTGRLCEITQGRVTTPNQRDRILAELSRYGVEMEKLAKDDVEEILKHDIDPTAREILEIRQMLGKSSAKKLNAMIERAVSGRVRDILVFHSASTGRYGGAGLQIQNFPRGSDKYDPDQLIENLKTGDLEWVECLYSKPLHAISACLRGFICAPPGAKLIGADYAAIEARVLAFLADEKTLLESFNTGVDVYKIMASRIYKKPVDQINKAERQLGKQAVLGCGYGMGAEKFQATCEGYKMDVDQDLAKLAVLSYRESFSAVPDFWHRLNAAAKATTQFNQVTDVNGIKFFLTKIGNKNALCARLLSGRLLYYFDPRLAMVKAPWGERILSLTYMTVDSQTKKWVRTKTYGGKLCENICQATAADIMTHAMRKLAKDSRFRLTMTVHDEIVCETKVENPDVKEFERILCDVPAWAKGCPVNAEGWTGRRYEK